MPFNATSSAPALTSFPRHSVIQEKPPTNKPFSFLPAFPFKINFSPFDLSGTSSPGSGGRTQSVGPERRPRLASRSRINDDFGVRSMGSVGRRQERNWDAHGKEKGKGKERETDSMQAARAATEWGNIVQGTSEGPEKTSRKSRDRDRSRGKGKEREREQWQKEIDYEYEMTADIRERMPTQSLPLSARDRERENRRREREQGRIRRSGERDGERDRGLEKVKVEEKESEMGAGTSQTSKSFEEQRKGYDHLRTKRHSITESQRSKPSVDIEQPKRRSSERNFKRDLAPSNPAYPPAGKPGWGSAPRLDRIVTSNLRGSSSHSMIQSTSSEHSSLTPSRSNSQTRKLRKAQRRSSSLTMGPPPTLPPSQPLPQPPTGVPRSSVDGPLRPKPGRKSGSTPPPTTRSPNISLPPEFSPVTRVSRSGSTTSSRSKARSQQAQSEPFRVTGLPASPQAYRVPLARRSTPHMSTTTTPTTSPPPTDSESEDVAGLGMVPISLPIPVALRAPPTASTGSSITTNSSASGSAPSPSQVNSMSTPSRRPSRLTKPKPVRVMSTPDLHALTVDGLDAPEPTSFSARPRPRMRADGGEIDRGSGMGSSTRANMLNSHRSGGSGLGNWKAFETELFWTAMPSTSVRTKGSSSTLATPSEKLEEATEFDFHVKLDGELVKRAGRNRSTESTSGRSLEFDVELSIGKVIWVKPSGPDQIPYTVPDNSSSKPPALRATILPSSFSHLVVPSLPSSPKEESPVSQSPSLAAALASSGIAALQPATGGKFPQSSSPWQQQHQENSRPSQTFPSSLRPSGEYGRTSRPQRTTVACGVTFCEGKMFSRGIYETATLPNSMGGVDLTVIDANTPSWPTEDGGVRISIGSYEIPRSSTSSDQTVRPPAPKEQEGKRSASFRKPSSRGDREQEDPPNSPHSTHSGPVGAFLSRASQRFSLAGSSNGSLEFPKSLVNGGGGFGTSSNTSSSLSQSILSHNDSQDFASPVVTRSNTRDLNDSPVILQQPPPGKQSKLRAGTAEDSSSESLTKRKRSFGFRFWQRASNNNDTSASDTSSSSTSSSPSKAKRSTKPKPRLTLEIRLVRTPPTSPNPEKAYGMSVPVTVPTPPPRPHLRNSMRRSEDKNRAFSHAGTRPA